MDATGRWRELVQRPDEELPLDEAALLIATHGDPGLNVAVELQRLDEIAARIGPADADRLCEGVFSTLGLRGDGETYDDPRKSYLHEVLNRRLGIPISLSVLLIEIGRRCGCHLQGVGMPGHFLVRDPESPEVLIDAFASGRRMDRAACEELYQRVAGPGSVLRAELLEPTGARAILARMLANLDRSFERRSDRGSLAWVTRLRLAIPGQPAADRLAIARRAVALGWHDQAADLMETLATEPGLPVEMADRLRRRSRRLRASLN